MTPRAARNVAVAKFIALGGMIVAISVLAVSVWAIQHDRRVRIAQINHAAVILCDYSRGNRLLQRQSIREAPQVVATRAKLAGATAAETRKVRAFTQKRTDILLARYPAITCPKSFVRSVDKVLTNSTSGG